MSRDGSGVYTLPAIYEAVDGNTATAAQHNTPLEDLAADANVARPVVAGGTGSTTSAGARTNLGVDPSRAYSAKSGNYTAVAGDKAVAFRFTAAATLSLTAAATLGNGWWCSVRADGGNVTIDPNSTEQIDGATTITVFNGMTLDIICNGSAFFSFYRVTTLTLESTDAGATVGPLVNLYRNSASPAAADVLGGINFQGKDSAGNIETFARVAASIEDPSNGTEAGNLILSALLNGVLNDIAKLEGSNRALSPVTNGTGSIGSSGLRWGNGFFDGTVTASAFSSATGTFSTSWAVGTFSTTGASHGKDASATAIRSSRIETSTVQHIQIYNPNGLVGSCSTNASATTWNTSSDERLKDFLGVYDPEEALAVIKANPTMRFSWKVDGSLAVGWSAQASYAVSNDLATPGVGELGDEDFVPWGMDLGKRTPYLWAVVPWLADRLGAAEARFAALEARIAALEA